eukprot:jgi/Botrbrau1/4378/Bobra.105_2s0024.1
MKMIVDVENQPPVWSKPFTPAPTDARKSSFALQGQSSCDYFTGFDLKSFSQDAGTDIHAHTTAWSLAASGAPVVQASCEGPMEKQDLGSVLEYINKNKLTENRPLRPPRILTENKYILGQAAGQIASSPIGWVQPSGPRKPGEGTEDAEQGIMRAYIDPNSGGVCLVITLVAAGFIVGERGKHVRAIQERTGTHILSANSELFDKQDIHQKIADNERPNRKFLITGEPSNVAQALRIIMDAVDHYKQLTEGACCGQRVGSEQIIHGIPFQYSAPPRHSVPYAAGIRGPHRRSKISRSNREGRNSARILDDVRHCLEVQEHAVAAAAAGALKVPQAFSYSMFSNVAGASVLPSTPNQVSQDPSAYLYGYGPECNSFFPQSMAMHGGSLPMSWYPHTPVTPPSSSLMGGPGLDFGPTDEDDHFSKIPFETARVLLQSPFKSASNKPFEDQPEKQGSGMSSSLTGNSLKGLSSADLGKDRNERISPVPSYTECLSKMSTEPSSDLHGQTSLQSLSGLSESLSLSSGLTFQSWAIPNTMGHWTSPAASMAPATPGQMMDFTSFPTPPDLFTVSKENCTIMTEAASAGRRSADWASCQVRA